MAFKLGQMVQGTKATGSIIWHTEKGSSTMQTGTSTMESGSKIKHKAMEFTNTRMGRCTTGNGLMICNMAKVKSRGLKKVHFPGIINAAQSMGKASIFGLTEAFILETGMKIKSKEWELTLGMMVVCM
jgi:hypothetical protein